MSAPRYAALARKLLVERSGSMPPPPPAAESRARAIAAVEGVLAARARRRRATRWAAAMVTTAAAAASVVGVLHYVGRHGATAVASPAPVGSGLQIVAHPAAGGASVVVSGSEAPLVEGRAVPAGSRIVTPADGRATFSFSTGTTVSLAEGADMSIEGEGSSQVLRLAGGSVDLHVAKLGPGQRFVVDTVDSEVEVRGTQFHVALVDPDTSCGKGARTRVVVNEGVVVVRHAGGEWRVAAGERWPSGCSTATSSVAGPAGDGARAAAIGKSVRVVGRAPVSALVEQNDLFAEGSSSRRRGDVEGALSAFDRLVTKYPASPLAESAYVEKMRILRSAPERGLTTAREYLARYPKGFARLEAEAIVAGAP